LLLSPIHTFEYLQGVTRAFAQQAIQAEREFITFKSHQELEEATRRDLETAKAMAQAEARGGWEQYMSAIEDEQAAQKGLQLATKRRDDAKAQRDAYAASSWGNSWAFKEPCEGRFSTARQAATGRTASSPKLVQAVRHSAVWRISRPKNRRG